VPDSRNQPAEFTETRFPLLVEKLRCEPIPAVRLRRGGRAMRSTTARWSIAAPSLPPIGCGGCYGLNGARPVSRFVSPSIPKAKRATLGLVDGEAVLKGRWCAW